MAERKSKKGGKKKGPKVVRPTEVPEFFDDEGKPRTLKMIDFPSGAKGRRAYFDYRCQFFGWKRDNVADATMARKQKRLAKLKDEIASLQAELDDMISEPTPVDDEPDDE